MTEPEPKHSTRSLLIHYGELALKGKNRSRFEALLQGNVRAVLGDMLAGKGERPRGRIIFALADDADLAEVKVRVSRVYGIANFAIAQSYPLELGAFTAAAAAVGVETPHESFAIRTRRSEKHFPVPSMEVSRHVGAAVQTATGTRVDLEHPDLEIRIDLLADRAMVYGRPERGAGGLPVGCEGKITMLLSGGIDSPVAAELLMKRGCWVRFLHFHSAPFTDIASQEKVLELARILALRQGRCIVDMIPFAGVQQEIIAKAPADVRVLLYRRFMIRIADRVARRYHSLALATGESLGQVASQTLPNLASINAVARLPVLRPLIGWDKEEIIVRARHIGTFELSIQPHQDCCSFMMPPKVATRSTPRQLEEAEAELDVDALVESAVAGLTSEEIRATYL